MLCFFSNHPKKFILNLVPIINGLIKIMEYQIGQIVTADMPFVHVLNKDRKSQYCDYCFFNSNVNDFHLKKCSQCKKMYYCGRECQKHDWKRHKFECKMYQNNYESISENLDRFLLRLFLFLKNNPERARDEHHFIDDPGTKRCFDDLMMHRAEIEKDSLRMECFNRICRRFQNCGITFEQETLFEYFCKICINSFSVFNVDLNEIGSGIYIAESQFNHSCTPNAAPIFSGSYLEIRAIKQINADDEITVNYVDLKESKEKRQESLLKQYYFQCTCPRCESDFDKEIDYDYLKRQIVQMDQCIMFNGDIGQEQWSEAYRIGLETLPLFEKIYDGLHPDLTVQMVRILKLRLLINGDDLEHETLEFINRVKNMISLTHGFNHELYKVFRQAVLTESNN